MIAELADYAALTPLQFWFCVAAVFAAGVVRGFSGFALSAIVMASVVVILPPVELIPVCFLLEAAASLVMVRGGFRNADMGIVWGLVIGSTIGVPIGLWATTSIPVETSKMAALIVILGLTLAQLFKAAPAGLQTRKGLYATGVSAGIVTGLASVGGMVVALYILASNKEARIMRASLVMFLSITLATSLVFLLLFGVLDVTAMRRGILFAPIVLGGVLLGSFLFRPSLEGLYKRFCLVLLLALSAAGLIRMI